MTAPTIIERACQRIRDSSRHEQRRHIRAMAWHYERERHLAGVLGAWIAGPYGPIADTRRIIRRLGHILHTQVMSNHPYKRRRIPYTRKAFYGELLTLWHLQAERQAAE